MNKLKINILLLCLFSVACINVVNGQKIDFSGQASAWSVFNFSKPYQAQGGLRYIPVLNNKFNINNKLTLETHLSANAYGSALLNANDNIDTDYKIKPYRLQLDLSGNQFDIRIGLQKINFGSASLLRPLMWFERIDARDPLQLTDGVYAALGRYYFLNNANVWLWTLYGNKNTKGWEIFESDNKIPEIGGRIQYPILTGEMAASYHHRNGVFGGIIPDTLSNSNGFSENRYAIDGKFDLEIGLWFETVLIHQDINFTDKNYQRLINIGADYTFNIANGLNLTCEYFTYTRTTSIFGKANNNEFGAVSLNYPINIINNLQTIVYYDFKNNDIYRFINFSWTYDKWMIYVMGFWNPDNFQIYQNLGETNNFGGYGAQIMLVFNH
ncbi:MAG: hypothetical protein U9R54_08550 [Bacteroidota bacterium]|nr:hypothetical protein [Bacteroidota bacterium]